MNSKKQTICEKHKCFAYCNPVKIPALSSAGDKIKHWKKQNVILTPEEHIDTVRLKTYECEYLDRNIGLCREYDNRPEICRNTKCPALDAESEEKQGEIIEEIKKKRFVEIKPFKNK